MIGIHLASLTRRWGDRCRATARPALLRSTGRRTGVRRPSAVRKGDCL